MVKTLFIIIAIIIPSGTVYSQNNGNPDSIIARVWLERAEHLLDFEPLSNEILDEAASALSIASEYQTPGRDALYLQAKLLISRKSDAADVSPVIQAYKLLTLSLDDPSEDNSGITLFEDRAVLWCSLALRLKDYHGLLDRYHNWPRGHRDDPLLLYAAARASLYLGLNIQAAELSIMGESLSEPGTDLTVLGNFIEGGAEPAFRAIALTAGNPDSISTLDAAWNRWPEILEEALRPWLLSGYLNAANTGNLVNLISSGMENLILLMYSPEDADMNMSRNYAVDLALLRQIRLADPLVGRDRVDVFLNGFTGKLEADADYDGYPEEIIKFVNGKIKSRIIDSNQDGFNEFEIIYEDNSPLYIQFQNGRLRLTYDKPNYPSLLSLQYQDGDLKVELSMSPGGFSWEAEGVEGYWLNPRDPVEPYWNDEKLWFGTRMVTFSAAVADTGRYGVSETYLVNGYPLRAIEKIYKDENRDELIHTREIIYDDGVPVAGRRSYRMDPDNPVHRLWELYERYENGELSGLAWDPGMTGSPAYLRDWALTGYLETQIWDLNSDGWIDVRRFLLPDDEVMVKDLLITEARREDLIPWQASDWSPWEQ